MILKAFFKNILSLLSFIFNLKNLKYYWSQAVIVTVPIILVLFPNFPSAIASHWFYISLFILALILCVIFSLYISQELMIKMRDMGELENQNNNLTSFLQTTPERVIKSIYKYLDFGYTERITVYRYVDSHFVPIGRYSKNIEFKKGGRNRYPNSEGYIGIAWKQGELVIEGLPDPDKQFKGYIREVKSKCNIEEMVISEMRMRSRSYYCLNLDNLNGDPIAVIVFESSNESLPKNTTEIKHLLDSSFGHLIVDMINMNLPPGRRAV